MIQNQNNNPSIAEMAIAAAVAGHSWESFAELIADKVISKMGTPNEKKNVCADNEQPIRGIRQLCKAFGMSTATATKLLREGKLPYRQIGNRYVFYLSEVKDALKVG